jgi:hypothetical protein
MLLKQRDGRRDEAIRLAPNFEKDFERENFRHPDVTFDGGMRDPLLQVSVF